MWGLFVLSTIGEPILKNKTPEPRTVLSAPARPTVRYLVSTREAIIYNIVPSKLMHVWDNQKHCTSCGMTPIKAAMSIRWERRCPKRL